MNIKNIYLILIIAPLLSCQTTQVQKLPITPTTEETITLEAAALPITDLMILDRKFYVNMYDKHYRLSRYVIYTLTADQLKKPSVARKDNFKTAPDLVKLKDVRVMKAEYANSGYEKGHLANSKDFTFSREANDASFYMDNMVPQSKNLNGDAWGRLERQVRLWACGEEKVNVITGPILKPGLPTLKSGLPVPKEFFKIVLDETPPKKMLAFVYTQTDSGDVMRERQVTLTALKKKVLHQMPKDAFANYPSEPIDTWKSDDCFSSQTKRVK